MKNYLESLRRDNMQYQVLDREGNLVVWIDTELEEQIIAKDYILQCGDNLKISETSEGIKGIIERVVKL
jgi:hypothetical protein